jgi:ankyrin repeat protein
MLWKTEQEGTGSSEQSVGEAARQNDETLLWILLKDGYSPDDSSGGRSALYWACLQNNMNIVKLLVEHGARGDGNGGRKDRRYIPLHLAAERNDYDMITILLWIPLDREVLDDQRRTAYEISIKSDPGAYKIRNA